jgi:Na+/citrate or Na+/malate symporter
MTNMSQAPATEKKGVSDLLGFKIFGMPLPLYVCVNYAITFPFL